MGKGIAVKTIIELVIAVIILILLAPMLIRSASAVWDKILGALGIVKMPLFEQALLCSYYRCVNGVNSIDTEEICKPFNIFGTPLPEDKVCNFLSEQFPVEVLIEKEEVISKDRLAQKMQLDCIITERTKASGSFNFDFNLLSPFYLNYFLFSQIWSNLQPSALLFLIKVTSGGKEASKACQVGGIEFSPTLAEAQINPGNYYIATYDNTACTFFGVICKNIKNYYVLTEKPYIELKYTTNGNFIRREDIAFSSSSSKRPYRIYLPEENMNYIFYVYKISNNLVQLTIQYSYNIDKVANINLGGTYTYRTPKGNYITFLVSNIEEEKATIDFFFSLY